MRFTKLFVRSVLALSVAMGGAACARDATPDKDQPADPRNACMNDRLLVETRAAMAAGEAALERGNHIEAITHFRKGIASLGNRYYRRQDIDDTGMRLVLAEIRESEKEWRFAANLLSRVLEGRLGMYHDNVLDQCRA